GEYVAACIAGVFSLEDAVRLVAARAQLMDRMPEGAMAAVPLSELEVQPLLSEHISLAAVNGPSLCVLSGPSEEIGRLTEQMAATGIACRHLHTSHAFHSNMMEPAVWPFINAVQGIPLSEPRIPYISNVTGTWITPDAATNPSYWGRHLRQTVRFADGLQELLRDPAWALLEAGPGQTLETLVRQQAKRNPDQLVVSSLPSARRERPDVASMLTTLGRLWLSGVRVNWQGFHANEKRHRIVMPTYPFERQRYWIGSPDRPRSASAHAANDAHREISDWFYIPGWKQALPSQAGEETDARKDGEHWLVFCDSTGLGSMLARQIEAAGADVIEVVEGEKYGRISETRYSMQPGDAAAYKLLMRELRDGERTPSRIVHLWSFDSESEEAEGLPAVERVQDRSFYSLVFLTQALGELNAQASIDVSVVSSQVHAITAEDDICPAKASLLGPAKVVPQELPGVRCRNIDLPAPRPGEALAGSLVELLLSELRSTDFHSVVAYRRGRRWLQTYEPMRLNVPQSDTPRLRKCGVYLITGGLGEIGLLLAEHLASSVQAKIVLTGRTGMPAREAWDSLLQEPESGIARQIRRLRRLEELGAEVMMARADVADLEQMREVMDAAVQRFGALHGVIHSAGNTKADGITALADTDRKACQSHFQPKVQGVLVLNELLRRQNLDFCFLVSSLSATLGGLGFTAYSAANAFMDAFAHLQKRTNPVPWISVNWDAWDFTSPTSASGYGPHTSEAILPEQGVEAFRRILDRAPTQIVVSTRELQTRLAQWIDLDLTHHAQQPAAAETPAHHHRPALTTEFVPPQTATEQKMAQIWEHLLGISPVGSEDNFFELGGHSLLAIQVISRLRDTFQVEVPVQRLFELPTIMALSEFIDRDRFVIDADDDRVREVLDLVEGLSEEEVKTLLEQRELWKEKKSGA
ncbi:MAG: SDR family NAD(P)-dependent oxidoreductase, partial [Bryobacteraceae bacterium]